MKKEEEEPKTWKARKHSTRWPDASVRHPWQSMNSDGKSTTGMSSPSVAAAAVLTCTMCAGHSASGFEATGGKRWSQGRAAVAREVWVQGSQIRIREQSRRGIVAGISPIRSWILLTGCRAGPGGRGEWGDHRRMRGGVCRWWSRRCALQPNLRRAVWERRPRGVLE